MASINARGKRKLFIGILGKAILGVLTTFRTFVAAYELFFENRSYPYIIVGIEECGENMDEVVSEEVNIFLSSNIEDLVYLDFLLYDDCYDQTPISLSFNMRPESNISIVDINILFNRNKINDTKLAFAGESGLDIDAERISGIFFLKGEIEGGTYSLEALPVEYSLDMQRKFTCSKSLANASSVGVAKQIEAYVRSCIFEQPWDPWGWGSSS